MTQHHADFNPQVQWNGHNVPSGSAPGIPLQDDGHPAGFVHERSGVRYIDKRIDEERHRHRKYNGFGQGDKPLRQALELGAKYARFHDPQRGTVYLADLDLFRTKGKAIQYPGQSLQWILPLQFWTKAGAADELASVATMHQPEAEQDMQLSLFGEVR